MFVVCVLRVCFCLFACGVELLLFVLTCFVGFSCLRCCCWCCCCVCVVCAVYACVLFVVSLNCAVLVRVVFFVVAVLCVGVVVVVSCVL